MADTKLSALTEVSVPELEDLLYLVEDPAGTPTQRKVSVSRLLGLLEPTRNDGRLTLTTAVPVTTSAVTGATSIFYTPDKGNRVSLYDGTRWRGYVFTERTLALGTLTSGKNYDVFLFDNAGTLTLEFSAAWTNDTTRADALALQDGILCKSGALTRRYLGTFRTTATTTTEDSLTKRFLWNACNQADRRLYRYDATTHTYDSATVRQWNADAANQVEFVLGVSRDALSVDLAADFISTSQAGGGGIPQVAVAMDSITAFTAGDDVLLRATASATAFTHRTKFGASTVFLPGLGYHYLAGLQASPLATTEDFNAIRLTSLIRA